MPSNKRIRLHDREEATPVDQPQQRDERNPRGIINAARLHLPLPVQRELLSQEQILGCELRMGSQRGRSQPQQVTGDAQDGSDRGARTGLGHGGRIVRDPQATPTVSGYLDGSSDQVRHGPMDSPKCGPHVM